MSSTSPPPPQAVTRWWPHRHRHTRRNKAPHRQQHTRRNKAPHRHRYAGSLDTPTNSSLSKRPGRSSAGSMRSGRLVAPMMKRSPLRFPPPLLPPLPLLAPVVMPSTSASSWWRGERGEERGGGSEVGRGGEGERRREERRERGRWGEGEGGGEARKIRNETWFRDALQWEKRSPTAHPTLDTFPFSHPAPDTTIAASVRNRSSARQCVARKIHLLASPFLTPNIMTSSRS